MSGKKKPYEAGHLLKELDRLSRDFGDRTGAAKLALLRRLFKQTILNPADLKAYHDLLCFIRAYPDSAALEKAVEHELRQFSKRVARYKKESRDPHGRKLVNSGIIDTITYHQFGLEILKHLMTYQAPWLSFGWDDNEASVNSAIDDILPHLVSWNENDALDYDELFDLRRWLTARRPGSEHEALRALFTLFDQAELPRPLIRQFFEKLELEITWDLSASKASRTLNRLSPAPKHYHNRPLLKRTSDLRATLSGRAGALKPVPPADGKKYVKLVNEVLAVRNRELDPLSMANPAEVYLIRPGRGLSILIFGTQPADRLPLESNFGALLIRNGLPVGYGVAAVLFDRVEIAINIFPAFRFGESSFIIEEFFRIFYHHFGARVFLVRSRQMGDDEPEALNSGAFWFYYKLGFRAVKPAVRKLAEKEFAKMKSRPNYRVPLTTMKKLAKSDVFFHTDRSRMNDWRELSITALGYRATDYFNRHHQGDRAEGSRAAASKALRLLKIKNISRWKEGERLALNRLAPLLLSIPDLERWPLKERIELAEIIRAKGSVRERTFVRLAGRHAKFKNALRLLAEKKLIKDR